MKAVPPTKKKWAHRGGYVETAEWAVFRAHQTPTTQPRERETQCPPLTNPADPPGSLLERFSDWLLDVYTPSARYT